MAKITVSVLKEMKKKSEPITMLTAYDYLTARIMDEAGIEIILVGDSLGMVFAGYESTLPVTLEQMLYHTEVVSRAVKSALVVGDMPFLTYQVSPEKAVENAGRFLQEAGANAVKIEGGTAMEETVKKLVSVGIPVMGHIGLTPQSVNQMGGFKVQGKSLAQARQLIKDAETLDKAGIFALVLECVPAEIAKIITSNINAPTIGIGAGSDCDGQVLVTPDLLGLTDSGFKFLKKYAGLQTEMTEAFKVYKKEVKQGKFPDSEHSFQLAPEVLRELNKS